jgi:catechol 2,3-dioxygenase-like lactoylglutathione lyase family enzyme
MTRITQVGRVMVPVADQDTAIAFYTAKLGSLALVPPQGEYQNQLMVVQEQ